MKTLRLPYILGSTRTLAVKYEVENLGETAYLAQIKITLSNITSFAKVPSNCKMEEGEMICDLQNGNPLFSNHRVSHAPLSEYTKFII